MKPMAPPWQTSFTNFVLNSVSENKSDMFKFGYAIAATI